MRHSAIDFTRGSIIKSLVLFSLPIVLGEILQGLYNSADALIVGRLVGKIGLAAVTVCGTIANLVVMFFNGMSVGSNVVVAKAFGRNDPAELERSVRVSFTFGVALGLALSAAGALAAPLLLDLAGARPDYYAPALVYLRIYLGGLVFTVIYNNSAGILRALGDTETPFLILVITCAVNVGLDWLLVGPIPLGVAGAAIATVLAQALSAAVTWRAVERRCRRCFDPAETARGRDLVGQVLDVGLSAGLQSALIGLSNIFVVRYMNLFPTEAVAGVGISQRLERFIVLPAKSFGITMTTCTGQNLGAGEFSRVREGKNRCLLLAVGVTLVISAAVYLLRAQSAALFSSDPTVVAVAVDAMGVLVPFIWIMAVREVLLGYLRGCGRNRGPMLLSLIGMIGVRQLFLAVTMGIRRDIGFLYACYPVGWGSTLALLAVYYLLVRRRLLPEKE